MNWPWSELGLPGPSDLEAVKHAYAERLKTTHPEEDPEGFQRLHEAYQLARRLARQRAKGAPPAQPAAPPEPPPEEPEEKTEEGFDYERLFAEGDRERQQARLDRAWERLYAARARREQAGFFDSALDGEEAENAAVSALHALDMLWDYGSSEDWNLFLHRQLFYNAQHNLDFVFGLEDFLLQRPGLPQDVQRKIFLAYGFYNGRPKAAYRGLYRLLLPSYRDAGRANAPFRRSVWERKKPFVIVGAFILTMMAVSLLCQIAELRRDAAERPTTGSADSSAYSSDSAEVVWSALEVPSTHDRQGEIDNDVPLEGDNKTSFFGLVVTYAPLEFPGLYATSGRGTAENSSETFQWMQVTGQDKQMEELVMNYYLSADKKSLYMIPEGHEGETVDVIRYKDWGGIAFYRYAG